MMYMAQTLNEATSAKVPDIKQFLNSHYLLAGNLVGGFFVCLIRRFIQREVGKRVKKIYGKFNLCQGYAWFLLEGATLNQNMLNL